MLPFTSCNKGLHELVLPVNVSVGISSCVLYLSLWGTVINVGFTCTILHYLANCLNSFEANSDVDTLDFDCNVLLYQSCDIRISLLP